MICPGLPRTGTLSLKAALTTLLGGRCYHGFDNLFGAQVCRVWCGMVWCGVVVTPALAQADVDFWLGVAGGSTTDAQIKEFFCSR